MLNNGLPPGPAQHVQTHRILSLQRQGIGLFRAEDLHLEPVPRLLPTGGGAQLSGLDLLISQQTGMPVVLADNPMDCVAIGTGILSGDLERLKHITRVAEEA